MIIDCHAHLGEDLAEDFQQDVDQLLRLMDDASVDTSVVFGFGGAPDWEEGNATVRAAGRAHADRLIPFLTANPGEVPKGERATYPSAVVRRMRDDGFRGIVLHPMMHNFLVGHPMVIELCTLCGRSGHPVVIHFLSQWVDETSAVPALVQACPETNFIVPSVYWNAGGTGLLTPYRNVFFDLSKGYARITVQPLLKAVGAERLLFASEAPMGSPALELKKLRHSQLSSEEQETILWRNASRLLGLAR